LAHYLAVSMATMTAVQMVSMMVAQSDLPMAGMSVCEMADLMAVLKVVH